MKRLYTDWHEHIQVLCLQLSEMVDVTTEEWRRIERSITRSSSTFGFLGIQGIACMVTLLKEDQSATMFNRFSDRKQAVRPLKSLNRGLKETKRQTCIHSSALSTVKWIRSRIAKNEELLKDPLIWDYNNSAIDQSILKLLIPQNLAYFKN